MATSRGERMQERMRGAGRHEVADVSFGLFLPVENTPEAPVEAPVEAPAEASIAEPVPSPVVVTRSTPNTSAKRRRLGTEAPSTRPQPVSTRSRTSSRPSSASKSDPYHIEHSPEEAQQLQYAEEAGDADDILQAGPEVSLRPSSRASVSSRLSIGPPVAEEITESPAGAPGSGHRRRVRVSNAATQSAKLQRAVMNDEAGLTGELTTSSPLARKTRKSAATPSALSARSGRTSGPSTLAKAVVDVDDVSPIARPPRKSNSTAASGSARSSLSAGQQSIISAVADEADELSSPVPLVESRRRAQAKSRTTRAKEPILAVDALEIENEEAEEIGIKEAARRIGRKRPRPSPPREESPELDSRATETARPTKKRRQKRVQDSPAKQSQPKMQKSKQGEAAQPRRRQSGNGERISISVQRYTKSQHYNEDDTDADILNSEIPFANSSGVNVVDVLSQMCDEVIESNLATLHAAAVNAQDTATRKAYRTKLRALEAFQEELRTRLLEHTIALDTMQALKKRVRSVQKEKLSLRNEIIRIRAERQQVALKMDAVRVQHEAETEESSHRLGLSSTMHDIELAVENGRAASELSSSEQKATDLANLELLVSRVAGQASAGGDGSGNLKQIQDFNAFLERAAAALEAR